MTQRGYLRHPTLHQDTIVFVCDDDLWSVSAAGGTARRLTAGLGEPATPVLSPDGKWIAFVGRDEQHPEVYLMAAEGGPARRLTWLGPDVIVRGWTPEGRVLFVSTYGQPFFRNYRAFTLNVEGGLPELLPHGQVNHLAYGPGKAKVIGRNTADPARWKRYRGGTAGHLWVDAAGDGNFRRMSELTGNITSPMYLGERIFYLTDAEGVGNLYSCRPDGSGQRRHTDHDVYYARNAQTDGRRIVYQCGADIWLFDPSSDRASCVAVETPAHRTQAARKFAPAADYMTGFEVHPAGHSVAVDVRGRLFSFALWEGAVRQHGAPDAVRYRHGQWLGDGSTIVAISDESGEERLQIFNDGARRGYDWDLGRVHAMRVAPSANQVAIANHRNELLIADLDSTSISVVDRSSTGRVEDLTWSADGAWLAYSFSTSSRHRAIKLLDVAAKSSTLVTRPEFRDYSPSFDPEGKYLYFLSARTFDPVYDEVQFELSFPRAARPYLIALQDDQRPPFDAPPKGLKPEDWAEKKEREERSRQRRVDIAGIERRIAAFPVVEGRFGKIAGAAGGKVLWTVLPIVGAHGRGGHSGVQGRLELFEFAAQGTEILQDQADDFVVASDGATVVLRAGKRLRAIQAEKIEKNGELQSDAPSRKSGWIDIDRIRLSLEPTREWRQMFREVWRLQRDQFWVPDMSGIDWEGIYKTYEPLLARVATRGELSDLIWEMQGELGTSHAYEFGGDHRRAPSIALGHLGAELALCDDGRSYEIRGIVEGDPWDADADSPLNAIGVRAKVGERIVAVNGQPVSRNQPPQALLVHQAGMKAELLLASGTDRSDNAPTRSVVIKTLADEVPARYREWVEHNRRWVHDKSKDRVGYLHLPDMMSAGFAEFHRYFTAECDRDALIVDVRYNRGGHVSELLLEKVARKRLGYDLQRWGEPIPYPAESPAGPVVALTNEHSGSDGDIFSHCFKLMGIGKLVGTRTWGGVIGIWPRHKLADGTETTQPEFSFWFNDVGWNVENYGTDPDIEVDNAPQDAAAQRDRQLETALATALKAVETAGSQAPRFGARPTLTRKPLPPRSLGE